MSGELHKELPGGPEETIPEAPQFTGLWDAIQRTVNRSSDEAFSPTEEDYEVLRRAVLEPVARGYIATNPQEQFEELVNSQLAGVDDESGRPVQIFLKKLRTVLQNSELTNQDPSRRDREAANYLKFSSRHELVDKFASRTIGGMVRERIKEAARNEVFLPNEGRRLDIQLSASPRMPWFPEAEIPDLVKRLGMRTPTGQTKQTHIPLPKAGQITELLVEVMESEGCSLSMDGAVELVMGVFHIPAEVATLSLDRKSPSDGRDGHERISELGDGKPEEEDGATGFEVPEFGLESETAEQVGQVGQIKSLVLDILEKRDGHHECNEKGSFYLAFFQFWGWRGETSQRIKATAYEKICGVSDATLFCREKVLFGELRKKLAKFPHPAIIHALEQLKAERIEIFRKAWGFSPFGEEDHS